MIIKKLNSTFHKHNRWLFGAFTIVIIITFLGFLTPTTDILSVFGGGGNGEFGTCYGKSVSLEEVRSQQLKDQVLSRLFRGDYGSENLIQAFQNYCMLQAAERLGISASDVEVGEALRMIFLMQGVKENELQSFYDRLLASFQADGIPADVVNNAIRDNLILNKLQQHFTEGIVITPSEAKSYYRLANTRYQIKVAVFAASSYLGQVKPDANELRNFFSNNADRYRISGKISILVVEFPFADYEKQAAALATDAALENYYKNTAGLISKFAKDGKPQPFAAVKSEVRADFLKAKMRELAEAKAIEFANSAYDKVSEAVADQKEKVFRSALAEAGLKASETGLIEFSADNVNQDLVRQLINADPAAAVSSAAIRDNAAVVGFRLEKIEERPAQLAEVAQQVNEDYLHAEAVKLAREAAAKAAGELAGVSDSAAVEKAFNALKGCTFREFSFSREQMPPEGMEAATLAATELAPGRVTGELPTLEGADIALLQKRIAPDMKKFEEQRSAIEAECLAIKQQQAMLQFNEQLFSNCTLNPVMEERYRN